VTCDCSLRTKTAFVRTQVTDADWLVGNLALRTYDAHDLTCSEMEFIEYSIQPGHVRLHSPNRIRITVMSMDWPGLQLKVRQVRPGTRK